MTEQLKILKLVASNVQRIEAIEITPDGAAVVVGGRNAQGKTSILDAITYALGGKGEFSAEPVRRGTDKAEIVLDLGDLIVTRTITAAGGGALKVTSRDGAAYASPQSILDKLVGSLAFDPLAFMREKPADQARTLTKLVGLDLAAYDRRRKTAYDDRTLVARRLKSLEGAVAATPEPPAEPPSGEDIAALVAQIGEIDAAHRDAIEACSTLAQWRETLKNNASKIAEVENQLEALKTKLASLHALAIEQRAEAEQWETVAARAGEIAEAMPSADAIRARVEAARTRERDRDRFAADAARRAAQVAEIENYRAEAKALSDQIEAVDAERDSAVAAAVMPVEGLGFGEDGVTYRDIPLAQSSGAERLRVSMAISLAMNPRLRIALLRDGSLLDEDGLALVATMAAERGAQVWIERVGEGKECSVVIEDGRVKGAPREQLALIPQEVTP
jgi:DNA repair exonuclease SbcCD ATPase subunit